MGHSVACKLKRLGNVTNDIDITSLFDFSYIEKMKAITTALYKKVKGSDLMGKVNEEILKKITDQLQDIQFGTLLITIHNDEITQLDVTRKQRLNKPQQYQASDYTKLKRNK